MKLLVIKFANSALLHQRVGRQSHLYSKLSLFRTSWQMLKVMPQVNPLDSYFPYMRAFKWDTAYLKGDPKYDVSNLKYLNLLSKNLIFNFTLLYFWFPLMYVVIKYIILKLLDVLTLFLLGFWTDLNYWGGLFWAPTM